MRLFIAEKPAMARAIAAALPGPFKKRNGYLECRDTQISWCVGHLLELAEPERYNPAWGRWQLDLLPLLPERWKLQARKGGAAQLKVLRELLKSADQIVHAGDPDREGQLLVDEVFGHLRVAKARQATIERLIINDLTPAAIKKALGRLRPNSEFFNLSQSALARSHADWLYGINLTRAWTLLGQAQGYSGVLSVGRVQTPLLGLVVRRDLAIAEFESVPFYQLDAKVQLDSGADFWVRWQPSEACRAWQDEQGRLLHRPLCEHVAGKIAGQCGRVTALDKKKAAEQAPLPFSLSALQIAAGKRFKFSAAKVLDLAQSLYEKHQLITYPRSDCRYLPSDHAHSGADIGHAIGKNCVALAQASAGADWTLRSRAFNDQKITAHHALVPTTKCLTSGCLSADEAKLYELIARQYLAQFYPRYAYEKTEVCVELGGGLFKARAKTPQQLGWRILFQRPQRATAKKEVATEDRNAQEFPPLQVGDTVRCVDSVIEDKATTPPEPFTDATLIAAMTGIARFVSDASIRQVLRETDGLGTEATRASIIETLIKRQLLYRSGREVHASEAGQRLIQALPEETTLADMTARWEAQLERICEGEESYAAFVAHLEETLHDLIDRARRDGGKALGALPKAQGNKPFKKTRRTRKKTSSRKKTTSQPSGVACSVCGQPMVRRKSARGDFLGCSQYPKCRHTQALPSAGREG